jgi:hypothetical protein
MPWADGLSVAVSFLFGHDVGFLLLATWSSWLTVRRASNTS